MQHDIYTRLAPIRTRHQNRESLRAAGRGLLLGAAVSLGLALAACAARAAGVDWPVSLVILPGAVAAVAVGGLAAGLRAARRRGLSWEATAALVDAHYRLQDQTLTALGFADKASRTELRPLEAAQLAKALTDLNQVDPRALVPTGFPKGLAAGVALLGLAVAISAWGIYAGPSPERAPETTGEVAGAVQPPQPKPPPAARPKQTPPRAEAQWRPARPGGVGARRAGPYDVPLEEIAAEAERRPGGVEQAARPAKDTAQPRAAGAALPSELVPPEYQQIIRRYFGAIRN